MPKFASIKDSEFSEFHIFATGQLKLRLSITPSYLCPLIVGG